ncbi:restriction endonuclease subunit S [Pediococcus pentosaceus]|uniref:Restriction endonuclease subunit S n=1 Tax=Pediococcus pentosaceus TaxID=1255 RepID=A0AB73HHS4_PEDPE|nr:restriction endonuclease subunit S [Pediococcus pentosaceus]MBF7115665.1 restriction endonuclease subunit S [Pediococcus pentosaceus]
MNAKQAKYPQLRFKGFTDPWEKRNLGDITAWTKGQGLPKEDLNEEKSGLEAVHYADLYKFSPVMHEVIHWTNSDDGRVIPNNSLLFPASDVTPVGLARTSTLKLSGVKAGGDVIIGQLDESIDSSFMSYQINATSKKILPLITGTTVKHVQAKSLATLSVSVTNMAEQTAIAGLFERIDKLIAANQRKLDLLKEQKKGYLQKMFPKNGSKFPQLRFAGFADAWEQRKLTEIVNRVNKSSNSDVLPKVEFEDIVSGEGRLNKDISSKLDSRKGTLFESENILYGKLRPYLKNWLFPDFEGVALGDFWVFEATDVSVPSFDYYLIQSDDYRKVANDTSGTKMPRSDWKNVSSTDFAIPSKNEQKQIGAFFKQLDDTITLHQRKLEKLQELKKGYLQKMFC